MVLSFLLSLCLQGQMDVISKLMQAGVSPLGSHVLSPTPFASSPSSSSSSFLSTKPVTISPRSSTGSLAVSPSPSFSSGFSPSSSSAFSPVVHSASTSSGPSLSSADLQSQIAEHKELLSSLKKEQKMLIDTVADMARQQHDMMSMLQKLLLQKK